MGNWPLPDTPRCAEMHLAEIALQEDMNSERKRDEASRLEKLKEEKAKADAEFRGDAADKRPRPRAYRARPRRRRSVLIDSSDGFDSVSETRSSSRPSSP